MTLFQVDFQRSFSYSIQSSSGMEFFSPLTVQWIEWSDCEKTLEKQILNNMEPLKPKQPLCHQYLSVTSTRQQWGKIKNDLNFAAVFLGFTLILVSVNWNELFDLWFHITLLRSQSQWISQFCNNAIGLFMVVLFSFLKNNERQTIYHFV